MLRPSENVKNELSENLVADIALPTPSYPCGF